MRQSELEFINHLRQSSPYVAQHAGKTIVIYLPGEIVADEAALLELAKDIILLKNLKINIALVLGATPQLNQALTDHRLPWQLDEGQRITSHEMLSTFQKTIGVVRSKVEAAFSQASAEQLCPVSVVSGNWVISQPKGVINGVDFQHTGRLRKINRKAIEATLQSEQIALLTPLTYSLTGEVFNLNSLALAVSISEQLSANKLMVFQPQAHLANLPKSISKRETALKAFEPEVTQQLINQLKQTSDSVKRIHLMDQAQPSALLLELFSRDGVGTLIFNDQYHEVRKASSLDIAGILNLISPLERDGILVKRSRETLELEIHNFFVLEIDKKVVGCAALYPIDHRVAELACLAVDPSYRGQNFGKALLTAIENHAISNHFRQLCTLTTQTDHWFIENAFLPSTIKELPNERQSLYNLQRKSKVLIKQLNP